MSLPTTLTKSPTSYFSLSGLHPDLKTLETPSEVVTPPTGKKSLDSSKIIKITGMCINASGFKKREMKTLPSNNTYINITQDQLDILKLRKPDKEFFDTVYGEVDSAEFRTPWLCSLLPEYNSEFDKGTLIKFYLFFDQASPKELNLYTISICSHKLFSHK